MFIDTSDSVVDPEAYAVCPSKLLFFKAWLTASNKVWSVEQYSFVVAHMSENENRWFQND